ncbi:hypothetical protein FRE64_14720 [Euhalothece natronophila Z-M001]|uniref:Isopropylmalate/homocitrate/citramalate synthase n=1 Tax=Euhalothece natronophila Z-M001 TaxID=522448 RepID=A0A5B8NPZ5_9CHRO|nr:hypothetical protein [Euhalothece natronophila]QDZ41084.1 hypothetical protein FRE64_14720 [Euhalothece natronophila Z-M001]
MAEYNSDKKKEKNNFLYPRYSYRGDVKPENMIFNSNLQEFAQRVNYICNLETAGKMDPEEAYQDIKQLWKQLKSSRKSLGINEQNSSSDS